MSEESDSVVFIEINGQLVRQKLGNICLHDVWELGGRILAKRPSQWARLREAKNLIKTSWRYEDNGYWASQRAAIAYAEWISPELRAELAKHLGAHEEEAQHSGGSELQPFNFNGAIVRVLDENGKPYFVAKDLVTAVEGFWNGIQCIEHVPSEWRLVRPILTNKGLRDVWFLSDEGRNFYLIRSDKPKALPLQKWLAGEVMPSLLKTGSYTIKPDPLTLTQQWVMGNQIKLLTDKMDEIEADAEREIKKAKEELQKEQDENRPLRDQNTELRELVKALTERLENAKNEFRELRKSKEDAEEDAFELSKAFRSGVAAMSRKRNEAVENLKNQALKKRIKQDDEENRARWRERNTNGKENPNQTDFDFKGHRN